MAREKIYLMGEVGWDNNGHSLADHLRNDSTEGEYEGIDLHINSEGGNVIQGMSLFAAMQTSPIPVNTYCDFCAMSMSGLLFLAGKERVMYPHSFIMIHKASGGSAADTAVLDSMNESLAIVLSELMGKPIEEVTAELLDGKDHTFNAQECLAMGLCTRIEEQIPAETMLAVAAKAEAYYAKAIKQASTTTMSEDEIKALKDQAAADKQRADALQAQLDQVAAAEAAKKEADAVAAVDKAIADGTVKAEEKEEALVMARANTAYFSKHFAKKPVTLPPSAASKVKASGAANPFEGKSFREIEKASGGSAYLAKLKTQDPDGYKALYEAQYSDN